MKGLLSFVAICGVFVVQVAGECAGVTSRNIPKMGAGYKTSVLATGLRTPRGIAFDTAGNLLVAEQQGGGIRRLTLKDDGDTVCVDTSKALISDGSVSSTYSLGYEVRIQSNLLI